MASRTTVRLPDGTERNALELDFAVDKEDWNEYCLGDGTKVRLKTSVVRIFQVLDDDGEPSFTAEGEPELLVWQDTTGMNPSNLEVALVGAVSEQTGKGRRGTLSSPPSAGGAPLRTAAAPPARVTLPPRFGGAPDVPEMPLEKVRNIFLVWLIATLRISWSSLRHPGHPVVIDRRTGNVWLKRD